MEFIDITQELFSGKVYPSDPSPLAEIIKNYEGGYKLSRISMCAHNATHLDAPSHFIVGGKDICSMPLDKFVGLAEVVEFNAALIAAKDIQERTKKGVKRLLIKGNGILTEDAALAIVNMGVELIATELQTVGDATSGHKIHKIFLEKDVVILEGIVLSAVAEGVYTLICLPLKMNNLEASPVRAVLIKE